MSVLAQLRAGVDAAWAALGDLLIDVEYQRISRSNYNPSTGTVSQSVTKVPLKAALVDFASEERKNSDMEAGDRRAIIRAKDLPFKADSADLLVEADGTSWSIVRVQGDPRIYWDLTIRR